MHGTREIPDLIERLAENYSAEGPLLVALEVTRDEHAMLARYMGHPNDDLRADRDRWAAYVSRPWWRRLAG